MRRPIDINMVPPAPVASILNPQRGYFSVILPVARTNLITNPSLETNATGYTAVGGSAGRVAGAGYHGAYGLSVSLTGGSPDDGVYYLTSSLTSGTTYVASVKFKSNSPGLKHKISIATTGGVDLAAYNFFATGNWQWVWVFWKENSSTTRRIYVRKNDSRTDAQNGFFIDGLQLEACGSEGVFVTTYIDGDQQPLIPGQNPPPYGWNGTPHASTSYRLATTRAGGRVVNLDMYKYKVVGYLGLGLTALANIGTPPASSDGATFQATIARSRSFVVNGFLDTTTSADLQRQRSALHSAFGPDGVTPRQPCVLQYQEYECERATGQMGRIVASYERGLEGQTNNPFREDVPLTFTQWLPAILAGDSGASLNVQSTVTTPHGIIQRSATGVWSNFGATGAPLGSFVYAIAYAPDGKLYVGGSFATMGGVANTSRIAYWDGSAWNAMGTGGANNEVKTILITPDGTVYVGGTFTGMGGVANTNSIAKWNGSAWSAVGTGVTTGSEVDTLAYGFDGSIYAGGNFGAMSAVANTLRIAKWNGSAWSALSTGANSAVYALVFRGDGLLYVGGAFTSIGGVVVSRLASWDGTAFADVGGGTNGTVSALAMGQNGLLYLGGIFTLAGAATNTAHIAAWNGGGFQPLSTGTDSDVYTLAVGPGGLLYAGGAFVIAGGLAMPDKQAVWNGSAWAAIDVDLPLSTTYVIAVSPTGVVTIGTDSPNGNATASGSTTVTNTGTALAYPAVVITGPSSGTSRIWQMRNVTTGKTLYLNYAISASETVTVQASSAGTRLTSSQRGDISGAILPGSSPDFALVPGASTISLFVADSTVTATMQWTIGMQSVSDLIDR